MEAIFDSLGHPIYITNGHKGYIIKWKLIVPICKKWSQNRDPDMSRVDEMIEYYKKGGYILSMIHLAEIKGEGIVCYDGNHRRELFDKCCDDFTTCIVDVMFNTTQNEIYKAFNNINKSVQLPAIYTEEGKDDIKVKDEILQLVRHYETKYKAFLSTSARCHAPNFNRDTLTDNIYNIYKSFNSIVSVEEIGRLLEQLNFEYSQGRICHPHSYYDVLPPKTSLLLEKCRKYNFWLFMEKTIPFEHVKKLADYQSQEKLISL